MKREMEKYKRMYEEADDKANKAQIQFEKAQVEKTNALETIRELNDNVKSLQQEKIKSVMKQEITDKMVRQKQKEKTE